MRETKKEEKLYHWLSDIVTRHGSTSPLSRGIMIHVNVISKLHHPHQSSFLLIQLTNHHSFCDSQEVSRQVRFARTQLEVPLAQQEERRQELTTHQVRISREKSLKWAALGGHVDIERGRGAIAGLFLINIASAGCNLKVSTA